MSEYVKTLRNAGMSPQSIIETLAEDLETMTGLYNQACDTSQKRREQIFQLKSTLRQAYIHCDYKEDGQELANKIKQLLGE